MEGRGFIGSRKEGSKYGQYKLRKKGKLNFHSEIMLVMIILRFV